MKTKRSFSYVLISSVLVLSVLQGCNDDSDANPAPPDVTPAAGKKATGGSGGSSSNGGSGNKAGTTTTPDGGTGSTDGGAPTETPVGGQAGQGGAGSVQPTCDPLLGADGCFNCPKNGEVEQWLNRCVDSDCVPFENTAARLPRLKADGSLPPLPN
jgi:hypothetical protein